LNTVDYVGLTNIDHWDLLYILHESEGYFKVLSLVYIHTRFGLEPKIKIHNNSMFTMFYYTTL